MIPITDRIIEKDLMGRPQKMSEFQPVSGSKSVG